MAALSAKGGFACWLKGEWSVIPNLALIITCYVLYRLVETTISAVQRNRTAGIFLGICAGICALVVSVLAYDIVYRASTSTGVGGLGQ